MLNLSAAKEIGALLCKDLLEGGSTRAEIKGSVARELEVVGDIEICAIPGSLERSKMGQAGLFGDHVESVSSVWQVLEDMRQEGRLVPIKPSTGALKAEVEDGDEVVKVAEGVFRPVDSRWEKKATDNPRALKVFLVKPGVIVDVYLPTPETWGVIATLRTGSAEFSRGLVTFWRDPAHGRRISDGRMFDRACALDTPEERDVFRVAGLQWVEPRDRLAFEPRLLSARRF